MKILDGKKTAQGIEAKLLKKISSYVRAPQLAIILVGERLDSLTYVRQKTKTAERLGISIRLFHFENNISEKRLMQEVEVLNAEQDVDGIIVQLPLPSHINPRTIINRIDPTKDVDGLTTLNQGKLLTGEPAFSPATARGVISLLKENGISLLGKRVTVVGRSLLVGRPVALLAEREGATVIQCHSKTKKIEELTQIADVLIVATGKPKLISLKHIRKGQVVVDVGISVVERKGGRTLVGDVDFEKVSKVVKAISPVPGGVGPMTVISLFENVTQAFEASQN